MPDKRKLELFDELMCWVADHTGNSYSYASALNVIGFTAKEACTELFECGLSMGEARDTINIAFGEDV